MIRIRRAAASEAKPIIALYSESGNGKTKSALLIARGFAGDMSRVVMLETEAGRGEAYANDPVVGGYNVLSLRESFGPKVYGEAIAEAEKSGAAVLIIDSASHEWEGVGGVLAQAAANQEAGKRGPLVWQKPKIEHAREFVGRLTQTPIPLVIVTLRAKYPMFEVTQRDIDRWDQAGRPGGDKARPKLGEWARSWKLEPKQSEDFLYEVFVHGWLDTDHRLHVTKYTLDEEMKRVFIDGEPVTVETGERLAQWSNFAPTRREPAAETRGADAPTVENPGGSVEAPTIDAHQRFTLERYLRQAKIPVGELLEAASVKTLGDIPAENYQRAEEWIKKRAARTSAP